MAGAIRIQHRIAAKNIALQNAGRNPGPAPICRVRKTRLAKIRRDAVELPPTDTHLISVGRVDANRWLICSITNNIIPIYDVDLIARVGTELRNQRWRNNHRRR